MNDKCHAKERDPYRRGYTADNLDSEYLECGNGPGRQNMEVGWPLKSEEGANSRVS